MSGEIAQILHQSAGDTRALVQLIQVHGGTVIPAEENRQPDSRLQIASIRFHGVVGVGPGLIGAAKDWRRLAARRARP